MVTIADHQKSLSLFLFLSLLMCVGSLHDAYAQTGRKITGRVMDATGELLIGVNVVDVNEPTNGVITDINGTYTIMVKGKNVSLKSFMSIQNVRRPLTQMKKALS